MSNVLENNATLEGELIGILREVTSTTAEAKEFVLAELPDVVSQVILWYGVYNFILFLSGLFILLVLIFVLPRYVGQGEYDEVSRKFKITLSHDTRGEVEIQVVGTVVASILLFITSVVTINLQWLKIWIAPKLWLIEYTASLVK